MSLKEDLPISKNAGETGETSIDRDDGIDSLLMLCELEAMKAKGEERTHFITVVRKVIELSELSDLELTTVNDLLKAFLQDDFQALAKIYRRMSYGNAFKVELMNYMIRMRKLDLLAGT